MFFNCRSPKSSKVRSSLPLTCSYAARETQMPPGSDCPSIRAARFTPSPKTSSPSIMMSPRLMPMRKIIRRSSDSASTRSPISDCIFAAQCTAATTLANSTRRPSPVVLKMRPWYAVISGSTTSALRTLSLAKVASSSVPISRLKPTTSAAKMAASRRWVISDAIFTWRFVLFRAI